MRRISSLLLIAFAAAVPAYAELPKPLVAGLENPQSVCTGLDGRTYVSQVGVVGKAGDGSVVVIDKGKVVPFATGLDDPKGLVAFGRFLFVADGDKVLRIDRAGKVNVYAAADKFPTKPVFLVDLAVDESGTLYVSDPGNPDGTGAAIYKLTAAGRGNVSLGKVTLVADAKTVPGLQSPDGLVMDGQSFLLVTDAGTGNLFRIKVADGTAEKLAGGLGAAMGMTWDPFGRLYIADWKAGKIFVVNRPGEKAEVFAEGFKDIGNIGLDPAMQNVLVTEGKAGTLTALPIGSPGQPVDTTPLPIETEVAFPDLKWEGWQSVTDSGKSVPLRPLVLTHANDGSHRTFVATEQGVIYVFPNDNAATKAAVFLDIHDRVKYADNQNEEGFLGLAFHPKYKENGEFFVYYTPKNARLTNQISRFKVSKTDPNKADPASEQEILRITKPYWNHDGGTLVFGPDGYLYFCHGDGGLGNDPHGNGQNLKTLLGKIHRIDIDNKDPGLQYAIPKDNPFAGQKDARGEIWAYGLRNVWRMAFDKKTGQLWAADVGQNLFEEIDRIRKGGNYGWSIREGLHPFGAKGVGPRPDLIDPVWEYSHAVGKSITGGGIYRGKQFPELDGMFLYADYVSGKIWALKYDEKEKRVVANRPIKDQTRPIMSFGEDENGEMYLMTYAANGKGVFRLKKQ
ncbi:MAG TPA: PQQ-dependent sugar dehydrogenase [Fimbriiglobus sp.]|jgi:glucose/arabinose dehydrogenase